MKKFVGTVTAAALAVGTLLVAPSATAVPSSVVTTAEFNAVAAGNSIEFVRKTFGSNGKVVERYDGPGTADDYVTLEFDTYYDEGRVELGFLRRTSGTWYLVSKYAYWGNVATRTADKATPAEFDRVKQGNTISYVRSTFGTNGTITEYLDAPGTEIDGVVVEWPTANAGGWVQVYFTKSAAGTWKVDTRSAFWNLLPDQDASKATEPGFNRVNHGNSLGHARTTFGSVGTIDYYSDAPGTADDALEVLWPVESADGWVIAGFAKSTQNVWKVNGRWAFWDRPAAPTDDVATPAELDALGVGSQLAHARDTLGTGGTINYYADAAGTDDDWLEIAWYTGTADEDLILGFDRSTAGTWTILDIWSPWPTITPLARGAVPEPEAVPAPARPRPDAPDRPSTGLLGAL